MNTEKTGETEEKTLQEAFAELEQLADLSEGDRSDP